MQILTSIRVLDCVRRSASVMSRHDVRGQAAAVADHAQARAVAAELFQLVAEIVPQQAHQVADLVGRAASSSRSRKRTA